MTPEQEMKKIEFQVAEVVKAKKHANDTEFGILYSERRLLQERDLRARKIDPSTIVEPSAAQQMNTVCEDLIQVLSDKESKPPLFSVPRLNELLPRHRKQLISFMALTGSGKSTLVASLADNIAKQKKRVLVITNEEFLPDVYARIAHIRSGIPMVRITNGNMTDEEQKIVFEIYAELVPYIVVIDKTYNNRSDIVISVNGIKSIFAHFPMSTYALTILDYYQKVTQDTEVSGKDSNQVQQELADELDTQRNLLPGAIAVFSQLKPDSKKEMDFENRLKGRKTIFEVCSEGLEVIKQRDTYTTKWVLHKQRMDNDYTDSVTTGFDKDFNTFVSLDDPAYQGKIGRWIRERQQTAQQPIPPIVPAKEPQDGSK